MNNQCLCAPVAGGGGGVGQKVYFVPQFVPDARKT